MAAKIPKNVRFRPDQVSALEALQTNETDFSALVRTAVDRYLSTSNVTSVREQPPRYHAVRALEKAAKKLSGMKKRQAAKKRAA